MDEARTGRHEGIEVVRARASDLDTVLSILEEAALWLACRSIAGWLPGSFSRRRIAVRIGRGEMYLAELAGETVGTFALQWSDEEVWGDAPGTAGYVYGLAVRRRFAGKGLGRGPVGRGVPSPRLPGGKPGGGLAGFRCRERSRVWGLEVSLYERRVARGGCGIGRPLLLYFPPSASGIVKPDPA